MNFVFHHKNLVGTEFLSFEKLKQRVTRHYPNIRPVERRRIVMSAPLAEMVFSHKKTTTIRFGSNVIEYPADAILPLFVVEHGQDHDEAAHKGALRILRVGYKSVAQLDEEDAHKDGFTSRQELLDTLQQFYGEMASTDLVCIYAFSLADVKNCTTV